jgi:ATP-binding cassette subfamily C protein CydD
MPLRAGRFLADGTEIRLDNPAWLESCGLLAQNPELMPGTIADNLDKFPGWKQSTPIASAIGKLLPGFLSGTGTCAGVENPGMSEGQRRAVALLRAVGSDATVLLLDEPVAGVDLDLAR